MERFVIRKNTLPYIHQWAVIDTDTGNKVGDYKTMKLAKRACEGFRQHGSQSESQSTKPGFEDALSAASERMRRPGGDPPPKRKKSPKHSNKRPVELG